MTSRFRKRAPTVTVGPDNKKSASSYLADARWQPDEQEMKARHLALGLTPA